MIKIFTIGFTKKNAQQFFELLKKNQIETIIDIRLNNGSQLAGFAKGTDLKYFAKELCNVNYKHILDFAPTKELLSDYQKGNIDWVIYEKRFNDIIKSRNVLSKYKASTFNNSCFLCSEEDAKNCHRRLIAEYLKENTDEDVKIIHLK